MEFKKFTSLENHYQTKTVALAEQLGIDKQQYIVTSKIHGANFSFWVTKENNEVVIKCAKRSGWIEDGEKFFNYKPVLEKYKDKLIHLRNSLLSDFVLTGELFGGNIQSGMCYPLEQDFVAFDMSFLDSNGVSPINKWVLFTTLKSDYGIPTVPLIGVYNSLQEAMEVNESYTSLLIRAGFDGDESHKEEEGIVIEPIIPTWFPNGSRVYFKKKTKRFLEKGGNKIPKPKEELPKELEGVLLSSFEYITKPRFNAVCSKIGEVTIKDIGKVMGLMTKDILEDMERDDIVIPESKKFMKLLQTQVMNFIRPLLLAK